MLFLTLIGSQRQDSVSLVTIILITRNVNLQSGLVQADINMTMLPVETQVSTDQIMETNASKQWDTFWCSDKEVINCGQTHYFKLLSNSLVIDNEAHQSRSATCNQQ